MSRPQWVIVESRKARRLHFSADVGESVSDANFIFSAVGTPPKHEGDNNFSYVESAAGDFAAFSQTTSDRFLCNFIKR
jgi:UDP-glucose 6-dehydrogenase